MEFSLEQRLDQIEERLNRIEAKLQPQSHLIRKSKTDSSNRVVSGNLLGLISSICFVLAAALIIKLSIDTGWLTHEKQLGLATLLGATLLGAGIFISNKDIIYASFLPAAGSTILYLTCFAAYAIYYLISFQTVIAATCLITALTLWFYIQFKHDIYAVIAVVGAYSAPLITNIDSIVFFCLYYFIVISLTFTTLSVWIQSRMLTFISAYLAITITALIGAELDINLIIASMLVLHFVIFSVGSYIYSQFTGQILTRKESWSFFPVLLVFYTMEYYFIDKIDPKFAPFVLIGAATLLIILTHSAKKWSSQNMINSDGMVVSFLTLVFFHSIYLNLLPAVVKPWLFVIGIMIYALFRKNIFEKEFNYTSFIPLIAASSILGIEYLNILSHLLQPLSISWTPVAWAAFVSMVIAIIKNRSSFNQNKNHIYAVLTLTQLMGILCLYQLTMNCSSLIMSLSWLSYALVVLLYSHTKKDLLMAKSTLITLGFVAVKTMLYDVTSTPNLVHIFNLILTGIVLYLSGFAIRSMAMLNGKEH